MFKVTFITGDNRLHSITSPSFATAALTYRALRDYGFATRIWRKDGTLMQ